MIFCDFYLPGQKGGGGMRSMVNLVERFRDKYEFFVVTRNYGGRNDPKPYSGVITGDWSSIGGAKVFYLSHKQMRLGMFRRLAAEIAPGLIIVNSAFSKPAILALLLRRLRFFRQIPIIVAPCGEFFPGALSIKPWKKRIFLIAAKSFGLYRRVIWKASSEAEGREIKKVIGKKARILAAPDVLPKHILPDFSPGKKPRKKKGSVKFIFYSRIDQKKNLIFFLCLLRQINIGQITLDIAGPVENETHWSECLKVIQKLPANITVNFVGGIDYNAGLNKLLESDVFVLPTLSENFGYVILEAMSAGCALLISDRTGWHSIEEKGIGRTIPLENPGEWLSAMRDFVEIDYAEFAAMSANARLFAEQCLSNTDGLEANARLLDVALKETKTT